METLNSKLSRRDYLKMSLLGVGSLALGGFAIGREGKFAKSKLNVALIGGGGIAKTAFKDCQLENVVAIADVDDVSAAEAYKLFPNAKRYRDFRKLLDAHHKELDLVIVSTPDHTHFAATYAAMERGIAVHTQKPLTHNIWQARTLKAAAKKFKVQTVMGNQGHNIEGMRLIKDWYDAGLVGDVREVHAWTGRTTTNNANAKLSYPAQPVPETLDWDLWLGPCSERPYNKEFCPAKWRWHWDFGSGGLGDIGCHTLDIPIYMMGLGYPSAVYMNESLDFRQEFDNKTPNTEAATYVYEYPAVGNRPAVKVYWYEGGRMPKFPQAILSGTPEMKKELNPGGCMIVGNKNTIISPGMRPVSPKLLNNWEEISRNLPEKKTPRAVGNPVQEIMAAIRGEIPGCGSNFDYAVPLTETVLLGTIAIRSNKKVIYNPEKMTFSDSTLNAYIKEPIRKGWESGEGII
jgi:predicted dehydrogenase